MTGVLAFLVAFDLVLTVWGFAFPSAWFRVWHDAPYVDPQGLLPRMAANWLAFFGLQVIALVRWRQSPKWLLVVAGCRLGDCLTDITCTIFADSMSIWGLTGFPAAGVGNLIVGLLLIRWHGRLTAAHSAR